MAHVLAASHGSGHVRRARIGAIGEEAACRHLERAGLRILARNWKSRYGEIDLVAEEDRTIVFVEVKARTSEAFGSPEEAITSSKIRRIRLAASSYLESRNLHDVNWRIDAVAVRCSPNGLIHSVEHYRDAAPPGSLAAP